MSAIDSEEIQNVFYVVDFDRTLIDSDKIFDIFVEVAMQFINIPKEKMLQAQEEIKQRGDSFDTAGYVRDYLNRVGRRDEWDELEKKFIHESRALNYLLPGATLLLEWLTTNKKQYGILTYGNPLWQRVKLTATGFNHVGHIIVEQKEKGKFIKNWQLSDGLYRIPDELGGGRASAIFMIDDKAVSFSNFPDAPCQGYWVLDPARELPSQIGHVPQNVIRYRDLIEVVQSLSQ